MNPDQSVAAEPGKGPDDRRPRPRQVGHDLPGAGQRESSGALLVFDVERAELEEILGDDPYYRTPASG